MTFAPTSTGEVASPLVSPRKAPTIVEEEEGRVGGASSLSVALVPHPSHAPTSSHMEVATTQPSTSLQGLYSISRNPLWPSILINQSTNQSIDQSVNQSIDQSVNRSISQLINQSIDQSVNQSTNQSIDQSINRPINQSVNRSISQSINQSINFPASLQGCHDAKQRGWKRKQQRQQGLQEKAWQS